MWTAEREILLDALRRAGNNKTRAARLLGISRRTLYRRLKRFQQPADRPDGSSSEVPPYQGRWDAW